MKILIYYTLAIISQVFFLKAFFPVSESSETAKVKRPTFLQDIKFNETFHHTRLADKLIFVVIDALRTDFVTPELTPFLYKTASESGCNFTVHVHSPTVTLPRIKSLTTGRVPQFIDVLLNLGSTETVRDSFLHQAVKKGKRVMFYGDNTWLKLYPSLFARSEGVSSFFVNDFTEVDDNVTRALNKELDQNDWDVMFLHYLGLDHIGHVFGPHSKLVPEKLAEMDRIIEKIFEKSQTWNEKSVIIVTGDHGMKDSGGHGGSSYAETHVPLVVLGHECLGGFVEQVDVAPSLSVLLGVDIPTSNVGRVISGFFGSSSVELRNYFLLYNSEVLNELNSDFQTILDEAKQLHYNFMKTGNSDDAVKATQLYEEYLSRNSKLLIKASVEQDMNSLVLSLLFLVFCFCKILSCSFEPSTPVIADLLLMCCLLYFSGFYFSIFIIFIVILTLYSLLSCISKLRKNLSYDLNTVITVFTVFHAFALISSSFMEEEHQIWYFYFSTFLIFSAAIHLNSKSLFFKFILAALAFRFSRTINQTGDKWALLPDVADWFLKEQNYSYLQLFFFSSLVLIWLCSYYNYNNSPVISILNALVLCLIYVFKSVYSNSIFLGRLIWLIIFFITAFCTFRSKSSINPWLLITSLLLREYNVILLPACVLISDLICKTYQNNFLKATAHYWLGNAFYFCQGHSNSLASVDVSAGYIGLRNYIPTIVIAQVLCHTYAFPVLSHLLLLKSCKDNASECWSVLLVWRMLCLIFVNSITVLQRHHLFIWSVFAPKLLIESCHAAVLLLELIVWFVIIKLFKK